ncbi:hypothetical protein C7S18_11905 [Ahniella affigens]|uniref:Uncharacterized protein n=1 Tax=Ahniella affigens TaxID=2021234 RepID=A0A2P1PSN7_9GAMM|nr:hypothetical protein [Ahniella affigens]AVP97855.1 hypothetical protein C7S18_11905 [Ahniella affigens]
MTDATNQTNPPISDDELLFFYWRDGLSDTRQREIARLLQQDPILQQRLASLSADLSVLAAPLDSDPDDLFSARLVRQLDQHVAALTPPVPSTGRARLRRLGPWAVAAAVVMSFLIWQAPKESDSVPVGPPGTVVAAANEPGGALNRRVAVGLEQASLQLADFDALDEAARQQLLADWRNQNELFAAAAERTGDAQLARTLRAFSPLLDALDEGSAASRDAALSQLEFEYTIMHTKLLREPSNGSTNEI